MMQTGGTDEVTCSIRFPYLDGELNGNSESNLVTWLHQIPYSGMSPHEQGKTNSNTTSNWVEWSDFSINYLASEGSTTSTKYWMLSAKQSTDTLWLGSADGSYGTDWSNIANWSSGAVPGDYTKVVVDPAVYKSELTINTSVSAGVMSIKSGGRVNGGSGTLTLNGSSTAYPGYDTWNNLGTFEPGSSTILFTSGGATLSGNTKFNNL